MLSSRQYVKDFLGDHLLAGLPGGSTVREAVDMMLGQHIGAVAIVENQELKGIFTERDLALKVVAVGRDPGKTKLAEVMTPNPETVAPDGKIHKALEKMRQLGFRHIPVVEGNRFLGMVSVRDLYAEIKNKLEDEIKEREAFIFGRSYGGA